MAVIPGTLVQTDAQVTIASWEGLGQVNSDVGESMHLGLVAGLTVQLTGTLGTGGEVTIQGSNTGEDTDWGTMQDPAGNPVVLDTIGQTFLIGNRPLYLRPSVTAGDGDTDLNVVMVGSRRGT